MKYNLLFILIILTSGCSSNPPLRDVYYVADGWFLAANVDDIMVHTKQVEPITENVLINGKRNSVQLKRWGVRVVNSGKEDVCVNIDWLQMDYRVGIMKGWVKLPSFSTVYLGYITQEPWTIGGKLIALDDAKWGVNRIHSVPLIKKQCIVYHKKI